MWKKAGGVLRLHITDCRQKDPAPFALRGVPVADGEAERKFIVIPRSIKFFTSNIFFLPNQVFLANPYPITREIHR